MLVKVRERPIGGVAQVTFKGIAVPGMLSRIIPGVDLGARPGDHTRWVGDDIVSVKLADFLVNVAAVNARNAVARFEMKEHGGNADECHGTTPATTLDVTGLVGGRIEMLVYERLLISGCMRIICDNLLLGDYSLTGTNDCKSHSKSARPIVGSAR
jgi:hypothetical protein